MQSITPYLYYQDVDAALKWLANAFGLEEYGERLTGPDGKTNHAAMTLNGGVVMMGWPGASYRNPKELRQATQCLHILVTNVDELFEQAKKAGAEILQGPEDKFYGQRTFGAADPEGHQWYFAQDIKKSSPLVPSKGAEDLGA